MVASRLDATGSTTAWAAKGRPTRPRRLPADALPAPAAVLLSRVRNGPSVEVFGVDVALHWVTAGFPLPGVVATWAWQRSTKQTTRAADRVRHPSSRMRRSGRRLPAGARHPGPPHTRYPARPVPHSGTIDLREIALLVMRFG